MGGGSSVPVEPDLSTHFSVPLAMAPHFLAYKKGSLCTINGERFIFAKIQNAPILVPLNYSPSILECLQNEAPTSKLSQYVGSVSIHVMWDDNKFVLLNSLPDGSEVYFDAVVFPQTNYYQAILVWQGRKPERAPMMLSDQYLITKGFEVQAHSVSFAKEPGVVQFTMENATNTAAINKENYFKNGKKAYNPNLPKTLKLSDAKAHIYEAVTIKDEIKSTSSTKYVCGCLWEDPKPNQILLPLIENGIYEYDETRVAFKKPKSAVYLLNNVEGTIKKDLDDISIEFQKLNMTLPCRLPTVLNDNKLIKLSKLELPCKVYVTMYQIAHQQVYSFKVLYASCETYQKIMDDGTPDASEGNSNIAINEYCTPAAKKLDMCD